VSTPEIPTPCHPMDMKSIEYKEVTLNMSAIQRKLALLIGAALLAMAFAAPSAMGATEVRDAETGELCPPVYPEPNKVNPPTWYTNNSPQSTVPPYQSGGCTYKMRYGIATINHTYQGNIACEVNFDLHIGPDGWGYLDNFSYPQLCNGKAMWTVVTPGSRIVMPPEFQPAYPYNEFYKYDDANTDFNVSIWTANRDAMGGLSGYYGYVSMNVIDADPENSESEMTIENQVPYGGQFGGGKWVIASPQIEGRGVFFSH